MSVNQQLFDYIKHSPTAFHAVRTAADMLRKAGYTPLTEAASWNLETGKGYFVTRNGSSLIAFRVPDLNFSGFMMTAAHSDSPTFKIKPNSALNGPYPRLSVEKYGGMLCSTWLDRPLGVAGRVVVKHPTDGICIRLADSETPVAVIPNVAIHMNRNANDGMSYNPAVDMIPMGDLDKFLKNVLQPITEPYEKAEIDEAQYYDDPTYRTKIDAGKPADKQEELLAHDLFLYNPADGVEINDLIVSPRLDDLQCAFCGLTAFLNAKKADNCPVFALFDNEEVGSQTKQGAASTFLSDVLTRLSENLGLSGEAYRRKVANSFLVSCDNAHAIHPNHPEYADKNHTVYLNKGIVIKYNANQKYTSDAVSTAIFESVCKEVGVPVQYYANRADMPGGSTLGNIANTQVSLNTVDIGIAQLAMHSSTETAGAQDTKFMIAALTNFYGKTLTANESDPDRYEMK